MQREHEEKRAQERKRKHDEFMDAVDARVDESVKAHRQWYGENLKKTMAKEAEECKRRQAEQSQDLLDLLLGADEHNAPPSSSAVQLGGSTSGGLPAGTHTIPVGASEPAPAPVVELGSLAAALGAYGDTWSHWGLRGHDAGHSTDFCHICHRDDSYRLGMCSVCKLPVCHNNGQCSRIAFSRATQRSYRICRMCDNLESAQRCM